MPFRGPVQPDLLVIGEAPGRWEDRHKRPFIGPSGSLLGRYLAQAGYDVTDRVAFANTVSCWPNRANQQPTYHEIDSCAKNLDDQIDYLAPDRILMCGLVALMAFWPNLPMKNARGRWFTIKGIPTLATYHPAAVLRDPALGPTMAEDIYKCYLGPTLTSRDGRDYECVWCLKPAEVWISEGRDVTNIPSSLGIGWCITDLRKYRRKYRGAGGGAVQLSLDNVDA